MPWLKFKSRTSDILWGTDMLSTRIALIIGSAVYGLSDTPLDWVFLYVAAMSAYHLYSEDKYCELSLITAFTGCGAWTFTTMSYVLAMNYHPLFAPLITLTAASWWLFVQTIVKWRYNHAASCSKRVN